MIDALKYNALRVVYVLFCLILFFTYPVIAILALPWVWFDSIGVWGHSSMEAWKDGWRIYSRQSLVDTVRMLIEPNGLR